MRLTQQQTRLITQAIFRLAGEHARIFLFGSRLNDNAKGGDVDILIETETPLSLIERAKIKLQLESELGMPVDVIAQTRDVAPTPFQTIARKHALRLG